MSVPRVVAFEAWSDLDPFAAALDALNFASRRPCPFASLAYLKTFLEHDEYRRDDDRLLFLLAFDGERPVAYLPLRRRRERILGFTCTRLGLLADHDTDRPHTVAAPADEARASEAFYRHLLARERDWTLLELPFQDQASGLDLLPPLPRGRYHARRLPTMPNSTLQLPFSSVGEYLGSLGGSQRKTSLQHARKLLAAGQVTGLWSGAPGARSRLLDLYLDLESRSWKAAAGAGIGRDPRRVAFFRELCQPSHPLGVHFLFLLLDDVPVASLLCGSLGTSDYGIETVFDEAYAGLSPGSALQFLAVHAALERGVRGINFNGNYAYYKARWGADVYETHAVQVYRVPSLHWLKARGGDLRRRLLSRRAASQESNPDRLRVVRAQADAEDAPARPARDDARRRAQETLAAIEAEGLGLQRIPGPALEEALGLRQASAPARRMRGRRGAR